MIERHSFYPMLPDCRFLADSYQPSLSASFGRVDLEMRAVTKP